MSDHANVDGRVQDTSKPETRIADTRWLWRYIWFHRGAVIGAVTSGIIGGIAASAEPFLVGVVVDHLQDKLDFSQLVADIGLMWALALVSVVAFFGTRFYSGQIAYGVNYHIRRDLFDNLLTQENGFFQRNQIGDLISRIHSDTETIWRLLALAFTRMSSASFNLIVIFLLLASVNLPLTAVVFAVLAVSTTFQVRAGAVLTPMFEKVQEQAGTVAGLVQDSVSGIQTIKTFGMEDSFKARFRVENLEYRRRWLFFKRRNEPVGMLPNMISNLAVGVVVLFGGIITIQGAMTLGNFTQFLLYLGWISQALLQLGMSYQRYQQTRGSLTRLTLLLRDTEIKSPDSVSQVPALQGNIRLENIGVRVDGQWLLRNISLDIPAGTVVGLVGPTGSGKTLLVSLLARVIDPTEGRVLLDGVDVRELELADVRRAIAYVPQSTFLFSAPLRDNIRMGREDAEDEELVRAAEISRVSNDLQQLPQGMDTLVGEKGVMLSGGQKQRVAIARAIVRDPAILVLDDALSSVDTRTAADILHGLREVLEDRTSFVIAHRIATVKDADLIVVLEDGEISETGTHDSLILQHGYYSRMAMRELAEEDLERIEQR